MQVKSGTIFDNFLITDDEKYAEEFGEETWGQTKDAEKKMKDEQDEEERKKAEEAAKAMEEEEEEDEGEGDEDDEEFDTEEVSELLQLWFWCSFARPSPSPVYTVCLYLCTCCFACSAKDSGLANWHFFFACTLHMPAI